MLSVVSTDIVGLIKESVLSAPGNILDIPSWSFATEQRCLRFFSPDNLRKLLGLYWASLYPNINLLHRANFERNPPNSVLVAVLAVLGLLLLSFHELSPLLASLADDLAGAYVSSDPADNEDARSWSGPVELIAFPHPSVRYHEATPGVSPESDIQGLHAALMVCLYQYWEGTESTQRRICLDRFPDLVSRAREVGVYTAKHPSYDEQSRDEFSWKEFVKREELIRLSLGIFLLDAAFVMFDNLPPQMDFQELTMHMALPEACFQAASANECYEHLQLLAEPGASPWKTSFCEALQMLGRDQLDLGTRVWFSTLDPLNLFALISGIHIMIFQARKLNFTSPRVETLQAALRNWKEYWEFFASSLKLLQRSAVRSADEFDLDNMWRRIGFVRHCDELWLLGSFMVHDLVVDLQQQQGPHSGLGLEAKQVQMFLATR